LNKCIVVSLFDQLISEKNLLQTYQRKVRKGSMGGIDRVSVEEFGRHLERNIKGLQQKIISSEFLRLLAASLDICPEFLGKRSRKGKG